MKPDRNSVRRVSARPHHRQFWIYAGAIVSMLVAIVFSWVTAAAAPPPNLEANDYSKTVAPFTLPFHLVDGYPMVAGTVNGVSGKFLLDTATPWGFFLNNHRIPLGKDRLLSTARAGSGQEMRLYLQNRPIDSIALADRVRFEALEGIIHTDWSFTAETFGADYLGSVGHEFIQNYLFAVDYDRQLIQFYPFEQFETLLADYAAADRIVAKIPFAASEGDEIRPMFNVALGSEVLNGFFDTGSLGILTLTENTRDALQRSGHLSLEAGEFLHGIRESYTSASIKGLQSGDRPLADVRNLSFTAGEKNEITFGYQFLKQYITLWNYRDRVMVLLSP